MMVQVTFAPTLMFPASSIPASQPAYEQTMLSWTCCFARASLFPEVSVLVRSMVAKGPHHHSAVRTKFYYSSNSSPGMGSWKDQVQTIGAVSALISTTALATFYMVSTNDHLRKDVELAEERAKKEIQLVEERAKKEIQLAQKDIGLVEERAKKEIEIAKKQIEIAKKETAERFLMYGYAAEFQRYQETVKMGDHYQSEKNGKDSAKDKE